MLKLAAFADEISPDLDEQIRVCIECGITHFELRSVWQTNVLELDGRRRKQIIQKLSASGLGVASIGSPIGKVKISEPWDKHFDRFKTAVDAAEYFESPLVRIFSYYPPEPSNDTPDDIRAHRDEVMRRMSAKVEHLEKHPSVTLVHENERQIYGEKCRECSDLMQTVNSTKLRSAFDFANFVQVGEDPLKCWRELKSFVAHIHVKDARAKDGKVVPPGEGDGHLAEIIKDAHAGGYRGFLSLEPHLASAGQFSGYSGPELFKVAAEALKNLCEESAIPLALGRTPAKAR